MKSSDILLSLNSGRLSVWEAQGHVCVYYEDAPVVDGPFLHYVFGRGHTFEEACDDYLRLIRGKTLRFKTYSGKSREVTVLG